MRGTAIGSGKDFFPIHGGVVVNASPLSRVEELFVRYWDNALCPPEAEELAALLEGDQVALDWFQFLSAHAVVSAELPPVALPGFSREGTEPAESRGECVPTPIPSKELAGWTRRRVLGVLGSGVAAGLGAIALGRTFWPAREGRGRESAEIVPVRVVDVQGTASVRAEDGRTISTTGTIPTGATVSTQGFGSTATLLYPDGSTVAILNDSAITVHESGRLLLLHQGTASAELRPRADDQRLTLSMALLSLARLNDTSMIVGQGSRSAEIEVLQGAVSVSAPTGEPMAIVHEGELLTVGANGVHTQQPIPQTPEEFSWNFAEPLPSLQVGRREVADGIPVFRCEAWPDPYYNGTVMYQIRSHNEWGRGMFRLVEESGIHVRYRAKRDSPRGQVCFCVRTLQSKCSDTGMLEYNGGFKASTDGAWQWLHIPARSMLANKHTPAFGSPWIGFLVILNTFETDVNLEIAEFRVTSPDK
jgi:hypothetical protein